VLAGRSSRTSSPCPVFFQVLLLPLLGAIADYSHRKKTMLFLFAYAGSAATVGPLFPRRTRYLLGGGCSCWQTSASGPRWSSTTPGFRTSRLRKTAIPFPPWGGRSGTSGRHPPSPESDPLLPCALLRPDDGGSGPYQPRLAGIWWALFSLLPLATMRRREAARPLPAGEGLLGTGFRQLRRTFAEAKRHPQLLLFLGAYMLYNGRGADRDRPLIPVRPGGAGLSVSTLTTAILMVQFVAFFGACSSTRSRSGWGAKAAWRSASSCGRGRSSTPTPGFGMRPDSTRWRHAWPSSSAGARPFPGPSSPDDPGRTGGGVLLPLRG